MARRRASIFALLCVFYGPAERQAHSAPDTTFADPAPPVLRELPDVVSPEASDHAALKFHSAARPLPTGTVTVDWPCFLGPSHNVVSAETKLLADFPDSGPPLVWEVRKGDGYAAPAVVAGRLVLFHRVGDEEVVECLEAETGKRFWRFACSAAYEDGYGYCNGPRASPVIDGERIFTFGAQGKLHCLKLATGQVHWKRDILAEFRIPPNFFGVGSTPLVEGDWLIINIGAPGGPCVAAFDKRTGKLVWGASRAMGRQLCLARAGNRAGAAPHLRLCRRQERSRDRRIAVHRSRRRESQLRVPLARHPL